MIGPEELCICGHAYIWHDISPACYVNEQSDLWHQCVFKLDNLKYLEKLSERS